MSARKARTLANSTSILIVDDHPMMRAGLAAQIADEPGMEVCGQTDNAEDALIAVESMSPDLAVIDLSLKESHGIDLITEIHARWPAVKMLVLSAYQESLYAERVLRAGASGYLNKQETGDKIFDAIRTVLAGERYLSPEMTKRLIGKAVGLKEGGNRSPIDALSDRELEVFQLIGEGRTAAAIARRLGLSPHTIDTHREKIKRKLNLGSANEVQRAATLWLLEQA